MNLLGRIVSVKILKVHAHAGIAGNEAADALASQAHDNPDVASDMFTDPIAKGPAWVRFWFAESLSDLDTLKDHALHQAQMAFTEHALNQPAAKKIHNSS